MQGEYYERETAIDVMMGLGSTMRTVARERTGKTRARYLVSMCKRVVSTLGEDMVCKNRAGQRPETHEVLISVSAYRYIKGVLTWKVVWCLLWLG